MKFCNSCSAIALAAFAAIPAFAQVSDDAVKIGVIVDMGGVYSANGGMGVVRAVELAVKDFGRRRQGKPIQVLSADYQNKVDIAASKARQWYDVERVDLI